MFSATFIPAADPSKTVLLCNTSRSLTEMKVVLNYRQLTEKVEGYAALFGTVIDRGNGRNILSFEVRRDSDYTPTKFVDAEAAMLFALDHPAKISGTGTLKLTLQGATTPATNRWLLNCNASLIEMPEWLGIAPLFRYVFDGGQITSVSPF